MFLEPFLFEEFCFKVITISLLWEKSNKYNHPHKHNTDCNYHNPNPPGTWCLC